MDSFDSEEFLAASVVLEQYKEDGQRHLDALNRLIQRLDTQSDRNHDTIKELKAAAEGFTETLKRTVSYSVRQSVKDAMQDTSQTAADAIKESFAPILQQMQNAADEATTAQAALTNSSQTFKRQHVINTSLAGFGAILLILFACWVSTVWQRQAVIDLNAQKKQLNDEIQTLQANADEWVQKAGKAKIERCGDKGRLCVHIDAKAGAFGDKSDYMILKGY